MKSPFHVVDDLVSPLQCETLIKELGLAKPNFDEAGDALKYERHMPMNLADGILRAFDQLCPELEERYEATVQAPHLLFQQYWENHRKPAEPIGAQGWRYIRKKWSKVRDIDLVGVLWLKDYCASAPLDPRFEVYGGKLEFPAYNFSLIPVRGTVVFFPATPHFVHALSHVMVGTLEQVLITAKMTTPTGGAWAYDANSFPGSYQEWFEGS